MWLFKNTKYTFGFLKLKSKKMNIIEFTDKAIEAIKNYGDNLHIPSDHALRVGIRQKNETNKNQTLLFVFL